MCVSVFKVGMLTLKANLPEISFQDKNDASLEKLLGYVQKHLPKDDDDQTQNTTTPVKKEEVKDSRIRDVSYQVRALFTLGLIFNPYCGLLVICCIIEIVANAGGVRAGAAQVLASAGQVQRGVGRRLPATRRRRLPRHADDVTQRRRRQPADCW